MLLRRARGLCGQLTQELHPDLEPGAYGLMLRVALKGGARATDLAACLTIGIGIGIGKPTIWRQLATLERLGLIERCRDAEDDRAQVVTHRRRCRPGGGGARRPPGPRARDAQQGERRRR